MRKRQRKRGNIIKLIIYKKDNSYKRKCGLVFIIFNRNPQIYRYASKKRKINIQYFIYIYIYVCNRYKI